MPRWLRQLFGDDVPPTADPPPGPGVTPEVFCGVELDGVAVALDLSKFSEPAPTEGDDTPPGPVTTEHRLFPSGTFHHPFREAPFKFNKEFRDGLIDSFKASGLDVPIDFNHASADPFDRSYEASAAAGWLTELVDKERAGLHGKITWTDRGLNAIRSGEYRYLSPEFGDRTFDKATGDEVNSPRLYAVALTNRPFLEKQKRVAASDTQTTEGDPMDPKTNQTAEPVSSPPTETAELDALKTENETLQAKADAQALALAEIDKARRAELMERYADRIAPAAREAIETFGDKSTPDEFAAFLEALPTVTMAEPQGGTADPPEPTEPEPDPVERSQSSRAWGLEDSWVKLAHVADGINADGTIRMKDGRILSQADALGEVE